MSLQCTYDKQNAGKCLDAFVSLAERNACSHIIQVTSVQKQLRHLQVVVIAGGACFNQDNVFGADCGNRSSRRICFLARQMESAANGGSAKYGGAPIYVSCEVKSADPTRVMLSESGVQIARRTVRFCVPPFRKRFSGGVFGGVAEDWVEYCVTEREEFAVGHLDFVFQFSVEVPDGPLVGQTKERVLDTARVVVPISIPASSNRDVVVGRDDATKNDLVLCAMLSEVNRIKLGDVKVIGRYTRCDDEVRTALKERVKEVQGALQVKPKFRANWLVWGPSGSGKSFLIQEIRRSCGDDVKWIYQNMLDLPSVGGDAVLRANVAAVGSGQNPVLVFLDEIDSSSSASFAYEVLCDQLDRFLASERSVVCVMAGSYRGGMLEMQKFMAGCAKGEDLLTRVPEHNQFQVPPLSELDQVTVFGSHVHQQRIMSGKGGPTEIEKLALFWILANDALKPARRVSDLAAQAVCRMRSDLPLQIEDLFEPGESALRDFLANSKGVVEKLGKHFCAFDD